MKKKTKQRYKKQNDPVLTIILKKKKKTETGWQRNEATQIQETGTYDRKKKNA